MTTDTTVVSADATGDTGASPAAADLTPAVTFTPEQQVALDKIVSDRLKRAQDKWKTDADAKAKADADAAEAKRQAEQGEWQSLAQRHEQRATELEGKYKETAAMLERANAVIVGLVESRKQGLPDTLLKTLEGRDIYDQLELANAFHEAMPQPAQPANGQTTRPATLPTPAPQGARGLTDEERRARATRTF